MLSGEARIEDEFSMMNVLLLEHHDPVRAEQIRQLMFEAYRIEADLIGVQDFYPLHRTSHDIAQSVSVFQGIFKEGDLLAVIELEFLAQAQIHIASLVVHPNAFRQGLASQLLRELLQNHATSLLTVSTAAVNHPALNLYETFGFVVEKRPSRTPDGISLLHLKRPAN